MNACKNNCGAARELNKALRLFLCLITALFRLFPMRVVAQTLSAGERVKLETEKDQLFQQMYAIRRTST